MVVQPDGGPGTVVAELLAAKVRLVSVAASKAVTAAPAARTARRGDRIRRPRRIRGVGCIRFSLLFGGRRVPAWAGMSGRGRRGRWVGDGVSGLPGRGSRS